MFNNRRVICLCGSTRFKEDFERVQRELTLKGDIVLSVGFFSHKLENSEEWSKNGKKEDLDKLHKDKIAMSDAILVINRDKYIGSSTRSEIEYAKQLGKDIVYLERMDREDK